jgi:hypothetical protein
LIKDLSRVKMAEVIHGEIIVWKRRNHLI